MLELFLQKKSRQTWKMFLQADWKALQASTPDDISTQKIHVETSANVSSQLFNDFVSCSELFSRHSGLARDCQS